MMIMILRSSSRVLPRYSTLINTLQAVYKSSAHAQKNSTFDVSFLGQLVALLMCHVLQDDLLDRVYKFHNCTVKIGQIVM